jgi:hypothetical protein
MGTGSVASIAGLGPGLFIATLAGAGCETEGPAVREGAIVPDRNDPLDRQVVEASWVGTGWNVDAVNCLPESESEPEPVVVRDA